MRPTETAALRSAVREVLDPSEEEWNEIEEKVEDIRYPNGRPEKDPLY